MGVDPFKIARTKMIEGQLVPGNIVSDAVLSVMADVPRELFVPDALRGSAYVDEDIEVAHGRYLMEPLLFAKMLEWAEVKAGDTVLDVGCATGYSTAVLCQLAKKVIGLEEQMELAEQARQVLTRMNSYNTEIITAPLTPGYPASGPYDVIIINGAVEVLPEPLTAQLAEGGRLITVKHEAPSAPNVAGLGKVLLCRKSGGRIFQNVLADASVPLLPGFVEKRDFVF